MQHSAMMAWFSLTLAFSGTFLGLVEQSLGDTNDVLEPIVLAVGFTPNPTQRSGVSGGEVAAETIVGTAQTPTGPCNGFISEQPDHILTLNTFFEELEIQISSQRDTTLIVQGVGGTWCSDDAANHNPRLSGQWQAGTYNVWVGSYRQGAYYPYQLAIRQPN
ncbi:hypothetical protein [Almyronema epifaneia]|uniref:Uncharacterized protein n=1 Tax=Almyronema epifaneia S1 TaxID=2991925 RepID=A0ABW6IJ82_9CYAN